MCRKQFVNYMKFHNHIYRMTDGFCSIIDGIFNIITLGFWSPYLGQKLLYIHSTWSIKKVQEFNKKDL